MFKPFTDPHGSLLATEASIDATFSFNGGFAYDQEGYIAIELTDGGDVSIGGFSATAAGRLVAELDGAISSYVSGLPVTDADKLVIVSVPIAPLATFISGVAVNSDGVVIYPLPANTGQIGSTFIVGTSELG